MAIEQINGLDVVVNKKPNSKIAFLVLHGYGADFNDLAPIADYVGRDLAVDWYFPNGILEVPIGPMWTGRAWFPIDMAALERAMQQGGHRDFKGNRPEGIGKAKKAILPIYQQLKTQYERVVIGGFSQGAMLSCDIAFSCDDKPGGLVILSGAYVDEANWSQWIPSCEGLRFMQSHGEADPVLPFQVAKELNSVLLETGLKGSFTSFQGGHEIPPNVLSELKHFLQNQVKLLT